MQFVHTSCEGTSSSTQSDRLGPSIELEDIVQFAREYDPQPMHVDPEAAKGSLVGGLIASGLHTSSLAARLIADSLPLGSTPVAIQNVDMVKWVRPVRAGDRLQLRQTILQSRKSQTSNAEIVQYKFDVLNGQDEEVMNQTAWIAFGPRADDLQQYMERGGDALAGSREEADGSSQRDQGSRHLDRGYFDEVVVGESAILGHHQFSAEEIERFTRTYDSLSCHWQHDESLLSQHSDSRIAPGWLVTSVWMKLYVTERNKTVHATASECGHKPRYGLSPGIWDMKWLAPVYAGDVLTYSARVSKTRLVNSKPGWGLVFYENDAVNQRGERVFECKTAIFWECRPT
ncbi:MaoC/PaaZ C-terminal domain-containing protein [Burkholderia sp. BCC1988]|uniref:MaoC/PaaZ C-terminal domain-containing protein n=1 Tax=Burkholderia sp. BCC1988 TaxID=2817443 RepID=UPI002AB31AE2|nr:MaoC/PaaZ C-terminal domain-containing protein [Burkholderia sp. BCC1988]